MGIEWPFLTLCMNKIFIVKHIALYIIVSKLSANDLELGPAVSLKFDFFFFSKTIQYISNQTQLCSAISKANYYYDLYNKILLLTILI